MCVILNPRPREHCNCQLARLDLISVLVMAKLDLNFSETVVDFVYTT